MIRWRKPPILPCEYAFADASSRRRIASIWRYNGASSSTVVSTSSDGSSGSTRTDSGVDMDAVTTPRPYPKVRGVATRLLEDIELCGAARGVDRADICGAALDPE